MLFASFSISHAQEETITVNANSYDISDNLDLEAVAYLFGESKDLEEFENKLNDSENQVCNLDLNEDGYVDYLRVIESNDNGVYHIVIQAVLGEDIFQDIATIDVDTTEEDNSTVQVVGNEYIYGTNYIIEPVYVSRPLIYDFFWNPYHTIWYSPYYWSYYPGWYYYRKPHRYSYYYAHMHNHYHHINCRYVRDRRHSKYHGRYNRSDYAKRYPEKSFSSRNKEYFNKYDMNQRRSLRSNATTTKRASQSTPAYTRKTRAVSSDWTKPRSSSTSRSTGIRYNKNASGEGKSRSVSNSSSSARRASSNAVRTSRSSSKSASSKAYTRPSNTRSSSRSSSVSRSTRSSSPTRSSSVNKSSNRSKSSSGTSSKSYRSSSSSRNSSSYSKPARSTSSSRSSNRSSSVRSSSSRSSSSSARSSRSSGGSRSSGSSSSSKSSSSGRR